MSKVDIGVSTPQRNTKYRWDPKDPTPDVAKSSYRGGPKGWPQIPYGCPIDMVLVPGETGEQRAFRRFPITAHKPGEMPDG